MWPSTLDWSLKRALEPVPALLAARLVAAEDGLAAAVLEALDIDVDPVADPDLGRLAVGAELLERHPAFGLQPDVDHHLVIVDIDHGTLDDGTFESAVRAELLIQHRGEVVAREPGILDLDGLRHQCSKRAGQDWPGLEVGQPRPVGAPAGHGLDVAKGHLEHRIGLERGGVQHQRVLSSTKWRDRPF